MITAEKVLLEAAELKKKKSEDYQGGTWNESDYFPYKEKSFSHMIHTKYLRMRNIVDGNQKTNFEALDDTLIDMAVYAAMFAAYIKNNKQKENMTKENSYFVGDKVSKVGGDYTFDGTVVSIFPKLSGATRVVVEDDRGVLHVYSEKNIKLRS